MKKMKMKAFAEKTFADGCEEYLRNCEARNLREGTIKHYREAMLQLYKYIDSDGLISDMNEDTMNDLVIELRDRKELRDTSIYTYARDLKTLLYFFMDKGYLETFKIKLVKADKEPIQTYSDREIKRLIKKPNMKECSFSEYKAWVIVCFLLSTGVRQKSLCNIKIEDLSIESEIINVRFTKNRKPLIIPLNRDIVLILKEYLIHRNGKDDDYLFCNVFGKQLTKGTLYHYLYDYNKKRGVETTGIHRFRHTFAKKWVLLGGNLATLQKILGHSSLAITDNYIEV